MILFFQNKLFSLTNRRKKTKGTLNICTNEVWNFSCVLGPWSTSDPELQGGLDWLMGGFCKTETSWAQRWEGATGPACSSLLFLSGQTPAFPQKKGVSNADSQRIMEMYPFSNRHEWRLSLPPPILFLPLACHLLLPFMERPWLSPQKNSVLCSWQSPLSLGQQGRSYRSHDADIGPPCAGH